MGAGLFAFSGPEVCLGLRPTLRPEFGTRCGNHLLDALYRVSAQAGIILVLRQNLAIGGCVRGNHDRFGMDLVYGGSPVAHLAPRLADMDFGADSAPLAVAPGSPRALRHLTHLPEQQEKGGRYGGRAR